MFRKTRFLLLSCIALCLLAACAPAAQVTPTIQPTVLGATLQPSPLPTGTPLPPAATRTPTVASSKENTPMSASPAPTTSGPEPSQVTLAKQDLAKRLSVNAGVIELVSFQPVTWPDGSLGCPQPGMAYTQVLVEGYRIQLRASGRLYEYHGGGAGAPFLCENPK